MIWLLPHPLPPAVSKLSLFLSLPVCRRSSLLTGEGVEEEEPSIRRRESLVLYKSFYNTILSPSPRRPHPSCLPPLFRFFKVFKETVKKRFCLPYIDTKKRGCFDLLRHYYITMYNGIIKCTKNILYNYIMILNFR
jgi:hypothetical protein